MNKKPNQQQREKAVFQYTTALERGDFESLSDVLQQAEEDVVLERMIMEVNEVYSYEFESAASNPSASNSQEVEPSSLALLLRQHHSSTRSRVQYAVQESRNS
ncbi:MAG: hypothetical protein ACPGWR_02260 [Ardenticatenaceae bacterium]